jgi:hypothetical protein
MEKRVKPDRRNNKHPQLDTAGMAFDLSDRTSATSSGGIALIHGLCKELKLDEEINKGSKVLKQHQPYHESDHVFNIAFNILSGGTCLEHLEYRRKDVPYLDALGTNSLPDPTTAGDFCRRFDSKFFIDRLQDSINRARLRAWSKQDDAFFDEAVIDGDGTICETTGCCKEGMDIAYDGTWGYHPLVVSLANTAEPLFLLNRSANRPSHEGAHEYFDRAGKLCREAGFRAIRFRGDTDFSQTAYLDGWDREGISFVFGIDAKKTLVNIAASLGSAVWRDFFFQEEPTPADTARQKPKNVKKEVIERRKFKHIRTTNEQIAEVSYRPTKCKRDYRLVILKKTISVTQGLFDNLEVQTRYFFYLSNDRFFSPYEIVTDARQRCDQENLNAHLKNGVHALAMPLDNLYSNWAYAVMASLAWSLKAWTALSVPVANRWETKHTKEKFLLLRMEFHTFLQALVNIPAQVVIHERKRIIRLLNWNEWTPVFFRLSQASAYPLRR